MKHTFSHRELKRIRKALEAVPGRYIGNSRDGTLLASIALPHGCDEPTRDYANTLAVALRKVNCYANINFALSFIADTISDKPYEILSYMPIATPCIRIYTWNRKQNSGWCKRLKNVMKKWG